HPFYVGAREPDTGRAAGARTQRHCYAREAAEDRRSLHQAPRDQDRRPRAEGSRAFRRQSADGAAGTLAVPQSEGSHPRRADPQPARRLALPKRLNDVGQTYGALIALLLLVLYNILFTPNFLTAQTLNINLTQVAPIVIVATGMTLVIATGGIDLSVGSLMAI